MDEDTYLESFRSFFDQVREEKNFLSFLDVELKDARRGQVQLFVPSNPYLFNPADVVHGAITAGLVDMACGLSIRTELGPSTKESFQTIDLNVSYVRPATNDLWAYGEVIRAGNHIGMARTEVKSQAPDGDKKVVASGQATYSYG